MVRTDLPFTYVSRKKLVSGWREYWRFRFGDRDCALPGSPGDPAFHARYAELIAQEQRLAQPGETPRHTFAWLCDRYLASAEFGALADSTQRDYRRTIDSHLRPVLGPERYDSINRAAVKLLRDSLRAQPRTAHKIKQMTSRLYSWAADDDLVEEGFNPAARIRRLKAKVRHIEVWSEEEIALFLTSCPAFLRTPVLLALHTGQRVADVAAMEWNQVQGRGPAMTIRVRQSKTGEMLDIPAHRVLRDHLATIRTTFGGRIVRSGDGRPLNASALSSALGRAVTAIDDMPARSLHGLRYAAAAAMEEAGCSVVQISSVLGHRTYQMAMQYISQRRAAKAAMARLEGAG